MRNAFQILAGFLERYEGEVEGRAVSEPPPEAQQQLRSLARGDLPEAEQADLFSALYQNPEWIGWLAREIKARRDHQP